LQLYGRDENLFTSHGRSGGGYRSASDFLSDRNKRRHGHGDGRAQLLLLRAFIRDDPPG
jgi:hypothetical protein